MNGDRKKSRRQRRLEDIKNTDSGLEYTGRHYRLAGDGSVQRRTWLRLAAGILLVLIITICSGMIGEAGSSDAYYVIIPYIGEVSSMFALAWFAFPLLYASRGALKQDMKVKETRSEGDPAPAKRSRGGGGKPQNAGDTDPMGRETQNAGHTDPAGRETQNAGHTDPMGRATQNAGHTDPMGRETQNAGHTDPAGRAAQNAGSTDLPQRKTQQDKDGVREYVLESAGDRIPGAARLLSIFGVIGFVMSSVYLMRNGFGESLVMSIAYPMAKAAAAAAAESCRRSFSAAEWIATDI